MTWRNPLVDPQPNDVVRRKSRGGCVVYDVYVRDRECDRVIAGPRPVEICGMVIGPTYSMSLDEWRVLCEGGRVIHVHELAEA